MSHNALWRASFLSLLLTPCASVAQESSHDEDALHLDDLEVLADPLDGSTQHILRPVSVLFGEDLDRKPHQTISDLLENEPGVAGASFGPSVGRPVIRGQSGARVGVLSDGISSMDVSTLSPDHAVAIDPAFVEQVEVLRGPATLLYGSAASGGLVNVIREEILDYVPESIEGEVLAEYGFASNVSNLGIKLNTGFDQFAVHIDAVRVSSKNLSIPGFERSEPHEEDIPGELTNSDRDQTTGTLGLSWIGEKGMIGFAISGLDNDYGVPGHSHAHGEEHDHDEEDHDDEDHEEEDHDEEEHDDEDHDHEEDHDEEHAEDEHGEEGVRIVQRQVRYDLKAEMESPIKGVSKIKTRWGYNDHNHQELEEGGIGTELDNKELEGRVEFLHNPIANWEGVVGLQLRDRDLTTSGEEAFLPTSELNSIGLFVLERYDHDRLHAEIGGRYEHQKTEAEGVSGDITHDLFSVSGGLGYHWTDAFDTRINVTRSQRAPALEELYSNGAHLATNTFEIGSTDLKEETSHALDLIFAYRTPRLRSELTLFATWIDDYIFSSEQDLNNDGIADRVEGDFDGHAEDILLDDDELLLVEYQQADARFYGFELNNRFTVYQDTRQTLDLRLWADYVRGKLKGGTNLPRITPWRVGGGLDYHRGDWLLYMDVVHAGEADHLANLETATDEYTKLDLGVRWQQRWAKEVRANWSFRMTNLLDDEIRAHTSFIKDLAPQEGRSAWLSLRVSF